MSKWMGHIQIFILKFLLCIFLQTGMHGYARNNDPIRFFHYTTKDGLPSSFVKSIVQDADGFIWAATRSAIVRFDGRAFREFAAFDSINKPIKIFCNRLFLNSDSVLIARTIHQEYYYFDSKRECFFPYPRLSSLGPTTTVTPVRGGYWICQNNQIFFLNERSGQREELASKLKLQPQFEGAQFIELVVTTKWLVFTTTRGQIYSYNFATNNLLEHHLPHGLNQNQFNLRFIDSHDNVWISSFDYGLGSLNLSNQENNFYSNKQQDLPHDLIHCIAEDKLGRVWIGTEGGLAIYSDKADGLRLYNFNLSDVNGLNSDPIYDVFCDQSGNVWLGTYFGGINFWSGEKHFFQNWFPGYQNWQIRGNVVSCLTEDSEKNLWVGLEDKGLNKINRQTGELTLYSMKNGSPRLSYDNLHALLFVNEHELWIGTYTGGINILNTRTNQMTYHNRETTNGILPNVIYSFQKVGDSIFIGTSEGVVVYNQKRREFNRLKPDVIGGFQFESLCLLDDNIWMSSGPRIYYYNIHTDSIANFDKVPDLRGINFVKADSKGLIWIGDCFKGLIMYNPQTEAIKYCNSANGFPSDWIYSMEEGQNGWFWVSTDKGLVKFNPEQNVNLLYDSNSGIPFEQFNYRASYTDREGNIFFGGNYGMISFREQDGIEIREKRPIVFTGFQLFNNRIQPGEQACLPVSINKTDRIALKYHQNVFTIEFSAFCYSSAGRCQYSYLLEGFDTQWNNVGNRNFATYTNLSPGTYVFRVKAAMSNSGDMESEERQLVIVVKPPFWLTGWAFALYALLVLLIFVIVFRVGKNLEKSRALAELEHREKVHADQIHKVKLEFFTNISHELKTPLTLILGPLKKIMEEEKISPSFRMRLIGIERNANRLFQLINQLLEFRKIENGKEHMKVTYNNVPVFADEISNSFKDHADAKDIDFEVKCSSNEAFAWFDVNKVEKIIFNLLSNAFKFTPVNGRIVFSIAVVKKTDSQGKDGNDLVISVADSGKGIAPELIDKVFDRFFQVEIDNGQNGGSGIGLAYVKSLVLLHKGTISVDSTVNKGTSFKIVLPADRHDYETHEISEEPILFKHSSDLVALTPDCDPVNESFNPDMLSNKPLILVVEDNIELINFMKESLELKYHIVTALHGVMALEKLETISPDLIISDIMMPEMDGIELTIRIKGNLKLSHIPIILLTSRGDVANKLEGLKSGADYYIEKPFYPEILEQNIENILNTRKRLIERFKTDDYLPIDEVTHSESDRIFIEKLSSIIKENISNPELDVMLLIKKMGISRSLLHLKLKGLLGCSSTEFIRAVRLKEAVKLISSGQCNISEAAYETGFSSPTYFTRRFREFYGKSPREYFNM